MPKIKLKYKVKIIEEKIPICPRCEAQMLHGFYHLDLHYTCSNDKCRYRISVGEFEFDNQN